MSGTLHSSETEHTLAPSRRGEPTWELALKYPRQGDWTESDYDLVQQDAFVELVDGCLEFLPMPTPLHQLLVDAFRDLLKAWLKQHSDVRRILTAPCPLRVDPDDRSVRVLVLENGTYREHGPFRGDAIAQSRLLPEFQVNVAELFAAAESP